MSRNQLKNYAPKARRDFIRAVSDRAKKIGITGDDQFEPMQEQGDVVVIGGQPFPRKVVSQRRSLESLIRLHGFNQTMEEIAYTWFNRFAAIRYMEIHGYLDHGYRVLSHPDGKADPEILEHAQHVDLTGLNKDTVVELKLDGTKGEQLYRMLLISQCNALNTAMPFLFERIDDQTELLLPDNLLHSDSVIRTMVSEIEEADWQKIEIIGWLYQFYISEKKDQVIGEVVKSEDIPAATQLFTPNWIVKYMVQNSLGHQWMATYPNSPLKGEMDYYIEPAEQTEDVRKQLVEITPTELNPEELTLLDPACGSGHILVEAYDLFKSIYEERGYHRRDIPKLILEKNLYGLDIDDRAAQLAGFALLMKARADDRRIMNEPVKMNVMAIQSSEGLDAAEIARHILPDGRVELVPSDDLMPETLHEPSLTMNVASEVKEGTIRSLINLFEDAKTFGSLITVPDNIVQALPALKGLVKHGEERELFKRQAIESIISLVCQVEILNRKYDCVVANPPYMGGKGMNGVLKDFAKQNFSISKSDLFACFITQGLNFGKPTALVSMITMESWMFLSSYQEFRQTLIQNHSLACLAHFPYDGRSPTVMNLNFGLSVMSVVKASIRDYKASFCCARYNELRDDGHPLQFPPENNRLRNVKLGVFEKLPGSPIAYWISKHARDVFENTPLGDLAKPRQGMATTNNDKFVRRWFEVESSKSSFISGSESEALLSGAKWFPYNKGGNYRKWFGNNEHVVNYENAGKTICDYIDNTPGAKVGSNGRVINRDKYFKESITWSFVSSAYFGVRYSQKGAVFDVGGSSIFLSGEEIFDFTAFLCSKISTFLLSILNPTLNFQVGNIASLPIPKFDSRIVRPLAKEAIKLSRIDWDSYETSWNFDVLPILRGKDLDRNIRVITESGV